MFAFEPLDHELVLLTGRKAGPDRFPRTSRPDAAVFRLGDADQAFLRHRVDRVVVDLIAPLELPGNRVFARQAVGLVHRHQPVPGKGLLGPVPEVGLIAGVHRDGAPVRPRLVALHRLRRGHVRGVLRHRHVVRVAGVVLRPDHQPRHLVVRIRGFPAAVGPVHRVAVHIDVVAVVDAAVFRRLRVDVQLVLADARRPFVHAVRIAEVRLVNLHPVVHRPLAVHPVPGLRGHAVELIPLLPQRVRVPLDLLPRQLDVAHRLVVVVLRRDGNAVVVRTDVRVAGHDGVRQIRCRFRPLAVHDEVFAVFDRFGLRPVRFIPAGTGPHGLGLVGLLPERMARIGPHHDHPALFRLQHRVGGVAVEGGGGVQHALHIDVHAVFVDELEVVAHTLVARHVRQLGGHAGERVEVVAGVVERPDAALPHLHPRVRHRHRHFRIGELHPAVGGKGDVVVVDVRGHLDVLGDQGLDVRIHVAHHVIVVLGVVQHVDVDDPAELAGGRHVGLAGEDLASILGGIDDQGRIPVVPVADFFAVVVRLGLDFLAVRGGVRRDVERIFAGVHRQARARPGGRGPGAGLVVAGPGMLPGAELPDVAGDDEHHRGPAGVHGLMEVVTGAFAVMDRGGLDRARIARPADQQVLRRAADLMHGVQVVVLEMHQIELPDRHRVDFAAVQQLHPMRAGQGRIDAAVLVVPAHLLAVQGHRRLLVQVPDHHPAQALHLLRLQRLNPARVALGEVRELVVGHHVARIQKL